jgi:hypothetical protein
MQSFLKMMLPFDENVVLGPLDCQEKRKELEEVVSLRLVLTEYRIILLGSESLPEYIRERTFRLEELADLKTAFNEKQGLQQLFLQGKDGSKTFLRLRKEDREAAQKLENYFRTKPVSPLPSLSTLKAKIMLNNPEVNSSYRKYVL